jgi:hypothetical protein
MVIVSEFGGKGVVVIIWWLELMIFFDYAMVVFNVLFCG